MLCHAPNPSKTTGQPNMGARRWRLRPIRFHPEGAARRGEAAPRPYLLIACPHVIDGLGLCKARPPRPWAIALLGY